MQIARDFGSTVIAEGVEDVDDLMTLSSLGVQLAQGFLLGRPQREPEFSSIYTAAVSHGASGILRSVS